MLTQTKARIAAMLQQVHNNGQAAVVHEDTEDSQGETGDPAPPDEEQIPPEHDDVPLQNSAGERPAGIEGTSVGTCVDTDSTIARSYPPCPAQCPGPDQWRGA